MSQHPREHPPEHPASVLTRPLDELPDPLPIPPFRPSRGQGAFDIRVKPPGSKSLTNRALLLAALARGGSRLRRPLLDAADTERMIAALRALGATIARTPEGDLEVRGVGGRWAVPPGGLRLDLGNAGTATRFLAAAASLSSAPITVDGNPRMRQRPIAELIAALTRLGVEPEFLGAPGCPPVRLNPPATLPHAPSIELPTTLSSQFISALLLIAPWIPGGITLRLSGTVTSAPYVAMTLGLLDRLGASVRNTEDLRVIRVVPPEDGEPLPACVEGFDMAIEPDASGATYFWGASALFAGAVARVQGLTHESLQGDARFPALLSRMGVQVSRNVEQTGSTATRGPAHLRPIMAELAPMPDTAMTLAAVCSFASGSSVLRGLRTLRVKESDRIAALQAELSKIGVRVESNVLGDPDGVTITPPASGVAQAPDAPRVEFDTYDDHRMAMSLALIGLRRPNVWIRNPRCVGKTYPGFWADLARIHGLTPA